MATTPVAAPANTVNVFEDDSAGDAALRSVGKMELWLSILSSIAVAVCVVVSMVLLHKYRERWTSGDFKVTESHCGKPRQKRDCKSGGECHTVQVTECGKISVEGFPHSFAASYEEPAQPPQKGDEVRVFYDPRDRRKSILGTNDWLDSHRTIIYAVLSLVLVLTIVRAYFLYVSAGSRVAQRVSGGYATLSALTSV